MHQLQHIIAGIQHIGSFHDVSNLVTDRLQRQAKLSVKGTHDYEQQMINISKAWMACMLISEADSVPYALRPYFISLVNIKAPPGDAETEENEEDEEATTSAAPAPAASIPVADARLRLERQARTCVEFINSLNGDDWHKRPKLFGRSAEHDVSENINAALKEFYNRFLPAAEYIDAHVRRADIDAKVDNNKKMTTYSDCALLAPSRSKVFIFQSQLEEDRANRKTRSSYVFEDTWIELPNRQPVRRVRFGRIYQLISHKLGDDEYEMADIDFFGTTRLDDSCRLRYVDLDVPRQRTSKLVPVAWLCGKQVPIAEPTENIPGKKRIYALRPM